MGRTLVHALHMQILLSALHCTYFEVTIVVLYIFLNGKKLKKKLLFWLNKI